MKKAGKYPIYLNLFLLATPNVWLLFVFLYGFGSAIVYYILIQFDKKSARRNRYDILYTFWLISVPTYFGIGQNFKPVYTPLRLFHGIMLISCIFYMQTIFFYIYRYIKVPVSHSQTKTIREMMENDFRLFGTSEFLDAIRSDERVSFRIHTQVFKLTFILFQYSKIKSFGVCNNLNNCLRLLEDDKVAIGGSRQHILNIERFSPSKIHCFDSKERVISYYISFLMRSDFHLISKINRIIRKLSDGGLIVYWDRISKRKRERELPYVIPIKLKLEHFYFGMFFTISCGSFLATLIFVLEIFVSKKMKQKRKPKIWTYLAWFIDGERHCLIDLPE